MTQLHLALHGATSYLSNPWAFGVNVARAALLLRKDVQRHLLLGRDELGFHHVRFGGLFDDAMAVVRPDGSFDFTRAEQVFDWLMENGLSPFVTLSGGPVALSAPAADVAPAGPREPTADHSATPTGDPEATDAEPPADRPPRPAGHPVTPDHSATPTADAGAADRAALPFDAGRWVEMVKALATFVDGRYGCDAQEWHFEVWPGVGDPAGAADSSYAAGTGGPTGWPTDRAAYLRLYDRAAVAIKSVNRQFKVGGPGSGDPAWVAEFVGHVAKPLDPSAEPAASAEPAERPAETAAELPVGVAPGDVASQVFNAPDGTSEADDEPAAGTGPSSAAGVEPLAAAASAESDGSAADPSAAQAFPLPAVRCDFVTVVGSAADPAALAADVSAARQAVTAALGESTPLYLASWHVAPAFHIANDRFSAAAAVSAASAAVAKHVAGMLYAAMSDVEGSGVDAEPVLVHSDGGVAGGDPPVRFEPFHGGAGLVTVNDVRKASFNAFRFLNEHVGYEVDHHWVDPTPGLSVLVTRDYHHVVRVLAAHHAGPTAKPARFTIEGLPESVKWGQVQIVRGGVGSPLEAWADRDGPEFVNRWLLDDLETAAHPGTAEVNFEEFPPSLEPGMVLQLAIPMPDDVAGMD